MKDSLELDMQAAEFENDEDYKNYLEDELTGKFICTEMNDSGEVGSPEKLDAELTKGNWEITGIHKFGAFGKDPRYSDQLLVSELKGLDGSNAHKFFGVCESTQKLRLIAMEEKCLFSLKDNINWHKHISQIFSYLKNDNRPYRLILKIYSPASVFDSILRTAMELPFDYMPSYLLIADFLDDNEVMIFSGDLVWDGKPINLPSIVDFFNDNADVMFTKFIDSTLGMNDEQIFKMFHFSYQHCLGTIRNQTLIDHLAFTFRQGKIVSKPRLTTDVDHWLESNKILKELLLDIAKDQVFGYQ